jgi:hypothetical protein
MIDRYTTLESRPCLITWNNEAPQGDKTMINGNVAFLFSSEQGIPPESFENFVNNHFREFPTLKAYHMARAYDEAKGTNHRIKLREQINALT